VLFLRPRDASQMRVPPEEVRSPVVEDNNPPDQDAGKTPEPFKVDVSAASLTLSSSDGSLQMRVWADKAEKTGAIYKIKDGSLQFMLENRDTLIVRVTDGSLQHDNQIARVDGQLIGHLIEGNQYFSAEKLVWNVNSKQVQIEEVRYIGPSVEVTGHSTRIDLATGEITFTGPVEAGI
jgi:hypothetical protein